MSVLNMSFMWHSGDDAVWDSIRHGHAGGGAAPAGQGGEEHPGVSSTQNSFPTCKNEVWLEKEEASFKKTFPWHAHLRLSSVQRNLICCAKKAGLMLFQFPEHLELWRLGESDGHGEGRHKHTHYHYIHIIYYMISAFSFVSSGGWSADRDM